MEQRRRIAKSIDPHADRFPLNEAQTAADREVLAKNYHQSSGDPDEILAGSALYWHTLEAQKKQVPEMENGAFMASRQYSGPYAYMINERLRSLDKIHSLDAEGIKNHPRNEFAPEGLERTKEEMLRGSWITGSDYYTIESLDNYFENAAPTMEQDAIVQRTLQDKDGEILRSMQALGPDGVMRDQGYLSTSATYEQNQFNEIMMNINVPKGTPYMAMDVLNQKGARGPETNSLEDPDFLEHEILFGRGHGLQISDIKQISENKYEITCDLLAAQKMELDLSKHPDPKWAEHFQEEYARSQAYANNYDFDEEYEFAQRLSKNDTPRLEKMDDFDLKDVDEPVLENNVHELDSVFSAYPSSTDIEQHEQSGTHVNQVGYSW